MKARNAIGAALGMSGYAGLAIPGGGGFGLFFPDPARSALIAILFALSAAALFTDAGLRPGVREDRANRWVLGVFALIGLRSAWLPAYTERKGVWISDGDGARWTGVVLFAAGGVLRMWPVKNHGHRRMDADYNSRAHGPNPRSLQHSRGPRGI
jgi:protein-S-isoprenylcysteine O-methyltransferase Ste14